MTRTDEIAVRLARELAKHFVVWLDPVTKVDWKLTAASYWREERLKFARTIYLSVHQYEATAIPVEHIVEELTRSIHAEIRGAEAERRKQPPQVPLGPLEMTVEERGPNDGR